MANDEKPNLSDREKAAKEIGDRVDKVIGDLLGNRLTPRDEKKLGDAVRDRSVQNAGKKAFKLETVG